MIPDINISEYDYDLPEDRIAQYPLRERDASRLLVFDGEKIFSGQFRDMVKFIPENSLLVFNNTRVIRARLLFTKESGANIEILCLEPLEPSGYSSSLSSDDPVEWKCMVGNLKKWKGEEISLAFRVGATWHKLSAVKAGSDGDALRVRFSWDAPGLSFGEVIDATGHIPLPPYIGRRDEPEDATRYQTVYSSEKGSVAAPTAGLHFTSHILEELERAGIHRTELTLHIGAGTFQPVRSALISGHRMHVEHFSVTIKTIRTIIENAGSVIAVGTTSVRTLESLCLTGEKIVMGLVNSEKDLFVEQWEPYNGLKRIPAAESLGALEQFMADRGLTRISASTRLMIVPGYDFRVTSGIITNFHQPKSTLLLLVSAWTGERWKKIYSYALDNHFRFLSYGDSSILLRGD